MKCRCGNEVHAATGWIFTEKVGLCGPCAREFARYYKDRMVKMSHQVKGRTGETFAEAAAKSIHGSVTFEEFMRDFSEMEKECDCGRSNPVSPGYAHTKECAAMIAGAEMWKAYISIRENARFCEEWFAEMARRQTIKTEEEEP